MAAVCLSLAVWATPIAAAEQAQPSPQTLARATFAGGCFWCMEPPFEKLDGVVSVTSGYTGGRTPHPTYEQVSAGGTGHLEAVQVLYDPSRIGYDALLDVFWHNVDPLDAAGQFCDRGDQYTTAIFVADPMQRRLAQASAQRVSERLGHGVATAIRDATAFQPAEEYHQDYYRKNPLRYRFYRSNCGRDRRLQELWGASPH